MNKLFKITNVTKEYRSGAENVFALNHISLEIEKNEYLSIVGPSGAGKSTLLNVLSGLDLPTKGEVLFFGKDISQMNQSKRAAWRNKHIGFVFQFYHLIEELSVIENILIASDMSKNSFNKCQDLLKYLELSQRKNFFPSQLSGGEKQRVAIARALINNPDIILCDEPTGNLDFATQEKVVGLLEQHHNQENKTVVIVTHNLELAKRTKRCINLKDGKVEE